MKILAIDYGRSKVGLAIGETDTKTSEPFMVIKYADLGVLLKKILNLITTEEIGVVILGLTGGTVDADAKNFGKLIRENSKVRLTYWDENYSTKDAISLSIESGMKQGKRRKMEDAFAAAVILDNYFEINDL